MAESGPELVERIYRAAIAGADPALSVRRALDPAQLSGQRTLVIGLGKAAGAMTTAALEILGPNESLVIDAESGDHPVPREHSYQAAETLETFLTRVHPGDHVVLLLSGGTSSLIAAPVDGVSREDLTRLFELLLGSGLDIHQTNLVRKRFSRWGAGRLAERVSGAHIRVLAISDVSGDRLESIGSGPCMPDPARAEEVIALLERSKLWSLAPGSVRSLLEETRQGKRNETPKPGHLAFERVTHRVIANNQTALDAAVLEAGRSGIRVQRGSELSGDAAEAGRVIASTTQNIEPSSCLVLGGETTVTLGKNSGHGGRCQELALAAALELESLGVNDITLLAAGTDGRDGPTDAAGAIVDSTTAGRIRAAGLDPVRHLKQHDAYPALDSAHALIRTGPSGTNVRDVVVVIRVSR